MTPETEMPTPSEQAPSVVPPGESPEEVAPPPGADIASPAATDQMEAENALSGEPAPDLTENDDSVDWADAKAELIKRWRVKPSGFQPYLDNLGLEENDLKQWVNDNGATPSAEDIREIAMRKAYQEMWGEEAPDAVIGDAQRMGMNAKQFKQAQRRDPAFRDTPKYKEEIQSRSKELNDGLLQGRGF